MRRLLRKGWEVEEKGGEEEEEGKEGEGGTRMGYRFSGEEVQ